MCGKINSMLVQNDPFIQDKQAEQQPQISKQDEELLALGEHQVPELEQLAHLPAGGVSGNILLRLCLINLCHRRRTYSDENL